MADETEDPGQAFAALMSGAAQAAAPETDPEAPFGYTTDAATGERRPKKAAGRPRKSPSLEELKASKAEAEQAGDVKAPEEDRAPQPAKRGRAGKAGKPDDEVVPYVPGQVARGINRLYRRTGKLIAGWDPVLGQGFITAATPAGDDDSVTVGEAWDELARVNPRVRKFLLKLIAGTGWAQLAWAHLPIALAVMASVDQHRKGEHPNQKIVIDEKTGKEKIVPARSFSEKLMASGMNMVSEGLPGSGDGESDNAGGLLEGLQPADMSQMMAMAQQMAGQMMGNGAPPPRPVATRGPQPKHSTRAQRSGKRH